MKVKVKEYVRDEKGRLLRTEEHEEYRENELERERKKEPNVQNHGTA